MLSGVPVLGEDDVLEALGEAVDDGDDPVAFGDSECSAYSINSRAEVVLDVDDEESVGGLEIHRNDFERQHGSGSG